MKQPSLQAGWPCHWLGIPSEAKVGVNSYKSLGEKQVQNFQLKSFLFTCNIRADRNGRRDHILMISKRMFFMKWRNWA